MDITTLTLAKKYVQNVIEGNEGLRGKEGKSAYQVAIENGFSGTEQEWLNSLQGEPGPAGHTPVKSVDYYTEEEKQEIIQEASKKVIVPTKTSDLENDSGFVTNIVNDLVNYHLKSEVYTKEEVQSLLGRISSLELIKVDVLPIEDIKTSAIYLVPSERSEENNIYTEYIYMDNKWEVIGNTSIDLSQYALKTEIPTKLSQLTNDANYSQFSGSYNDLDDKPTFVKDVTSRGVSIVQNGVAIIPEAITNGVVGVIGVSSTYGLNVSTSANLRASTITETSYPSRDDQMFIGKGTLENIKYLLLKNAMCDGKGAEWTVDEQTAARARMGAVSSSDVTTAINNALSAISVAEEGTY